MQWLAGIFIGLGFGLLLLYVIINEYCNMQSMTAFAKGVVIDRNFDSDNDQYDVISFSDDVGNSVEFTEMTSWLRRRRIGTDLIVRYNPDDPSHATVQCISQRLRRIVGFVFGIGFTVVSIGGLVNWIRDFLSA